MNETLEIPKQIERRILKRYSKGKTLAEYQSASYYLEDLSRCLHPQLKSLEDACSSFKRTGVRVYGGYLRNLSGQIEVCKVGKGYVGRLPNGKVGLPRDTTASGTNEVLLDEAFIPCDSELGAEILEYYMQYRLGSKARSGLPMWIQKAIQSKFSRKFNKWLEPAINPKTLQKGGREEFDFSDCWEDRINIFNSLLSDFKLVKNIGKTNFNDIKYNHQENGSDVLVDYLIAVGDPVNAMIEMKDFWMLIKPRGGKNTTTLLGICKFLERLYEAGKKSPTDVVDIFFGGLWPSAFEGGQNDIDKYYFSPNVKIGYVDTKDEDWLSQRQDLINEGCNLIVIFASIQSIDEEVNKELVDNYKQADKEGIVLEEFDASKLEEIKKLGIKYAIIDECDHGIRTDNSKRVLKDLDFDVRIQLSGSDLYALKNLIQEDPKNYYAYTILDEMDDVDAGIIKRPLLKRCSLNVKGDGKLPFDDLTSDEMNAKGYSRRMLNMFQTYTHELLEKSTKEKRKEILKYKFNEVDKLWYDGTGNKITFLQTIEIDRLLDRLIASENSGISIFEYQHIFNTVPGVAGGMALYNHITEFRKDIKHKVTTGWNFRNARRIEKGIKDWMGVLEGKELGTEKTIFITVGKMLRGASCPWSCVIRMDDYVDFKIGHQIELRSQNAYGPDGKHCLVFDANPWRALAYPYDIAKHKTSGAEMNEMLSTKCLRLIPYMLGELEASQATEQDVIDSYMIFRSIRECFATEKVFNEANLKKNYELFENVDSYKADKTERDERAGKNKNKTEEEEKKKRKNKKDKEELKNKDIQYEKLLAKAKSVSANLPYLQWLNDTLYTDISDLFEKSNSEVLHDWLDYTGLWKRPRRNLPLPNIVRKEWEKQDALKLKKLIEVFDVHEINHQLLISSVKIKEGLPIQDILDLNRRKKGDVVVPRELAQEIIDLLPVNWSSKPKVLDPACGRGEFIGLIKEKLLSAGVPETEIKNCIFYADRTPINTLTANKVVDLSNGFCYNNIEELKDIYGEKGLNMKFDIIIGNPPFDEYDVGGGQNKIYNQISKLSLSLLANDGKLSFITPASVLKKSKRFSLVGQEGLKLVDFSTNKKFLKVGVNIISWLIDKSYQGNEVEVIAEDGTKSIQKRHRVIYDYTKSDEGFTKIYQGLKLVTNEIHKRMFKQNNFGPALSKNPTQKHKYILYKKNKQDKEAVFYSKRVPYFLGKNKFTVGMTKVLNDDAVTIDKDDFDPGYMTTEINSQQEIDNIKSFIFSDYFKEHAEKWKALDGYGYNYALKYLPPFDKNKFWTSKEVKEFLESYADE